MCVFQTKVLARGIPLLNRLLPLSSPLTDYAWDVITDFASEILEKEQADEVSEIVDRRKTHTLAQKRSFFVRMVSDPKIYNPAINKAQTPHRMSTELTSPGHDGTVVKVQSPKYVFLLRSHHLICHFNPMLYIISSTIPGHPVQRHGSAGHWHSYSHPPMMARRMMSHSGK